MYQFISYLMLLLLTFLSFLLIVIVLLQRGRGGGLAGALGGAGGQSAFGTKAGDMFTKITVGMALIWVLVAGMSINVLHWSRSTVYEGGADAGTTIGTGADADAPAADAVTPDFGDPAPLDATPSTETDAPAAEGANVPTEGEMKPAEPAAEAEKVTPPAEVKPAEVKPTDTPAVETKPAEEKPAGETEAAPESKSAPATEKPAPAPPTDSPAAETPAPENN